VRNGAGAVAARNRCRVRRGRPAVGRLAYLMAFEDYVAWMVGITGGIGMVGCYVAFCCGRMGTAVNGFQDPRKAGVMGLLAAPVAMLA
jgi:hypothetical protein